MVFTLPLIELFLISTIILFYVALIRKTKDSRLPPGPPGLPLIGNIHQLDKPPHTTFLKWSKIYGKIFSVKLGLIDTIVVNDPKLIKDLFNDVASTGRSQNPVFLAMSDGNHGIINAEGSHWEEQRRFVLRKLRDFGFAKSSMEGMIVEEADSLINLIKSKEGTPIACNRLFNAAVVNSLWYIVSGEKSNNGSYQSDSGILEKSEKMMGGMQATTRSGLVFAPFLRYIAPDFFGWTNFMKAIKAINEFSQESIETHRSNLNQNCPTDLIDHYLNEIENTTQSNSSFHKKTGDVHLQAVIIDLFEAGSETTANTLAWTLLYLSHHQGIQDKLIKEIQTVIGNSRPPSLSDKTSLPYVEAVIMEVLRKSALTPLGVPHRMINDMIFHGYLLPKNTIILANIYACLHDPEIWNDPEYFRPERFMSDDGTKVVRNDALIPFSAGRRFCIGESLARDTLFLFLTRIFQRFNVFPDPDNPKPDFEPEIGFMNLPKPFKVVIKEQKL